jgi:hypothetical protein
VDTHITLTDVDRPGETLEVEVVAGNESILKLAVPNTIVQFIVSRRGCEEPYEGSLGGRVFRFSPPAAAATKAPVAGAASSQGLSGE